MTSLGPSLVSDGDDYSPDELRERIAALFREHYTGLCGFVTRYVKSRDIAEEVVQEVFLRVWEQSEAPAAILPTRAYLYAAARNQALTILRHERVVDRHVRRQTSPGTPVPTHPPANASVELDELTRVARRAIASLPERSRIVFQLSRDQGMTYAEIATVLGISVKTVEGTMMRALKKLRSALDGLGVLGLALHSVVRLLS